jgi:hypothetical protein
VKVLGDKSRLHSLTRIVSLIAYANNRVCSVATYLSYWRISAVPRRRQCPSGQVLLAAIASMIVVAGRVLQAGFSAFVSWDLAVEQRNQGLASGGGLHAVSEHDVARADRFPVEALVGVTVRSQRGAAQ